MNDDISIMNFEDAIKQASSTECSVLLGNGFSMSLHDQFSYQSLYHVAKSGLIKNDKNLTEKLIAIFTELETFDFEKVLSNFNVAMRVIKNYGGKSLSDKISDDLQKIRSSFIHSFIYVHPDNQASLPDHVKRNVRLFLSNFSQIYTTNYDLLLYWILVSNEIDQSNIQIPYNDGFNYFSQPGTPWLENPIWIDHENQNVYYLHGAFHIFVNEYIYKLKYEESSKLVDQISNKISNNDYPLIVFEGESEQKKIQINSNPYLWQSYEYFKKITASLFVFGSALNEHSDKHIINAIKDSKVASVYIGLYDEKNSDDLINQAISLERSNKKVYFFDSKSAVSWDAP